MKKMHIILSISLFVSTLTIAQSNTFPTNDNATLGGTYYLKAGARFYFQSPANSANGQTRGILSNNIYWDPATSLWQIPSPGSKNDFGMLRFDPTGKISFFNGPVTTDALAYSLSDADLDAYRRMTITKDGYVGIGVNIPQYTLDINGILNTNNSAFFNGKVGIGTVNPNAMLHIHLRKQ